jgi:hypothetical protein
MPLLQWIVPDLARRKPNKVQRVFSSGGTAHAVVRNPLPSQVKLKHTAAERIRDPPGFNPRLGAKFRAHRPRPTASFLDGLHTAGVVLAFPRVTYGNKAPLRKRAPKARATLSFSRPLPWRLFRQRLLRSRLPLFRPLPLPAQTFLQILHNQRNSSVRWVLRRIRLPQPLIRKPAHVCHLVRANSVFLHHPPRRVRPVCGQLPVSVCRSRQILLRVRVALHRNVVRQFA